MQRIAINLRPLGGLAAAGGAAVHQTSGKNAGASVAETQRSDSPSRTAIGVEEGDDDYVNIFHSSPVSRGEVDSALGALMGLSEQGPSSSQHLALALPSAAARPSSGVGGPLITEMDDAESVTSDGSEVNRSFYRADHVSPVFSDSEDTSAALCTPVEMLGDMVHGLLQNPVVVSAIQEQLMQDPHFAALSRAANPGLPAAAACLALDGRPGPDSYPIHSRVRAPGMQQQADPLLQMLAGLQRGVMAAARNLMTGFERLGNLLRGLAAELGEVLKGAGHSGAGGHAPGAANGVSLDKAVISIACAAAVLVFARRLHPNLAAQFRVMSV